MGDLGLQRKALQFFSPVMDHTLGLWELDSSTPESKHGLNVQTVCLVRHVRHQGA